jgi:pimeloyl-ACP methyl ester carboxylesterase
MPFITLDDNTEVNYIEKKGGDKTIVFVHGNLANASWWEMIFKRLPESYSCYALDFPGSGKTNETGKRHTLKYFSLILEMFVNKLNLNKIYLAGHSMGGGVSQEYTLNNPEKVEKLILVDTCPAEGFHVLYDRGEANMRKLMENKDLLNLAIRAVAPKCTDEEFLKKAVADAEIASEQVFIEQPVTLHEFNSVKRIGNIKCPVLFIHGKYDKFIPHDAVLRTVDLVKGAKIVYTEAGHSPSVETPDEFTKALLDFIEG